MKATLYPCPFTHIFCDTFNCQNRAVWYIGNPEVIHSTSLKLCPDCVKNIIATAPAELVAGGAELKQQITDELTAKHEKEMAALRAADEAQAEAQRQMIDKLMQKLALERRVEPQVEEKPPEEQAPPEGAIYRCLECDREFQTKAALASHMRTHK